MTGKIPINPHTKACMDLLMITIIPIVPTFGTGAGWLDIVSGYRSGCSWVDFLALILGPLNRVGLAGAGNEAAGLFLLD